MGRQHYQRKNHQQRHVPYRNNRQRRYNVDGGDGKTPNGQQTIPQHGKQNNRFHGHLDETTRHLVKLCTEQHGIIHHLENLKKFNPWKKKVHNIINNIKIPTGKLQEQTLNKLVKMTDDFVEKLKDAVVEDLTLKNEEIEKQSSTIQNTPDRKSVV